MNLGAIIGFIAGHPLNRGQRLRAVGRFLRWQLASRLMPYPIALPFVDELRLFAERGMTGATGNYYCGLHEAEDMAFVLHFMRPGDAFYDIGANVGSYSLLAAAAGAGKVVGFEPSSETGGRFLQNIAINALSGVVSLENVALGASNGEIGFTRGNDTTNHIVADNEVPSASETVTLRCFDEFYVPGIPSFIKIDVEGFERQVLAGACAALRDPALMGLLIEDNGSDRRYPSDGSLSDLLRQHGFAAFRYDSSTRQLALASDVRSSANVLFLRNVQAADERVRSARKFRLINGWI